MTIDPIIIDCHGDRLIGLLHAGDAAASRAAIIVVGGPQYRAGSHRQFYFLAQALAAAGFPTLRFDYRGMGDSDGDLLGFEHIGDDIRAAIDRLQDTLPRVRETVLIGLCDAASAAMMYASNDARVSAIVVMNPWVRSEESHARATVKHYYFQRIFSADLWRKILQGQFAWRESFSSLRAMLGRAFASTPQEKGSDEPYQTRMRTGLKQFGGRTLLVTSGDDLTAREFLDSVKASSDWKNTLARPSVSHKSLPEANHTFAAQEWRTQVNEFITDWMRSW